MWPTRIVMSPQRSNLVLPTDVPDIEFHILVCHTLHVEADRGDGSDVLVGEFQFVENCCIGVDGQ